MNATLPVGLTLRAWLTNHGHRLLWYDDGNVKGLYKQDPDVGLLLSYPGPWEYYDHTLDVLLDDDVELSAEEAMKFWESARREKPELNA